MRYARLKLTIGIAAVAAAGLLRAQGPAKADAEYLRAAYETFRSMPRVPAGVSWQFLGPTNISGRATDIAVADKNGARRIYAGYATSGVWKTDDNGATWQDVFQNQASQSIGDLAVAPSDPDIVWVGTGEANLFRASMPGVGIYKSVDGGKTFAHMGLADSQTIARIVVHPTNPNIVYVAASGHEWTDNETRGVYKTTDGGRTWRRSLYISPRTGAIDLVMDPTDPNTVYAATWQRIRRKWSDPRVEPGYSESGVWKTTDGGANWKDASAGLPEARYRGRIGIDISRSNPKVLYAFIDNYEPGRPPRENERDAYTRPIQEARIKAAEVYRTDDKGATWKKVSESNDYMTQHSGTYGWVFGQIRVDPLDENTIYTLGLALNVSHDAGKTFTRVPGTHGDHHGLWIDPKSPTTLYSANDGGFFQSEDAGKTWKFAVSAGGVHFYDVALDTSSPIWAYGSVQDVGSRRGKVDISKGRDQIPAVAWENAPGGEGSNHAIDPTNPSIVYSHGFYGNFTRDDMSIAPAARGRQNDPAVAPSGGTKGAQPGSQRSTPIRPPDEALRAQWMAPVIISPHDSNVIFLGYQYVFKSANRGDAWQKLSPDLSSNDKEQMLPKSSNEIPYQTVSALAESPRVKGLLYAGTDDGHFNVSRDGTSWTDVTASLPVKKWISRVVPSQYADGTVYVTQRGREDDDFAPYVYKSTDFGRTFTRIVGNLPAGPVNVIREDPTNPNVLYLGTDFGAWISTSGGAKWDVLGGGLPAVQVSDLQYHTRDKIIVISTYGRGMYAFDATKIQ
jgi:photosystem II stability/assembly factor-like uncharacterized protein